MKSISSESPTVPLITVRTIQTVIGTNEAMAGYCRLTKLGRRSTEMNVTAPTKMERVDVTIEYV